MFISIQYLGKVDKKQLFIDFITSKKTEVIHLSDVESMFIIICQVRKIYHNNFTDITTII